ncbi:hypothetical protein OEA41_000057 [Lepraria neglecta]|uniref:tetrahydrofolate synthase n=1 Tax=Lepraria neglecta TaxID=209136 RepID=A0AAE0DPF5_9LECA|nr:hypothetical protein OEA41_000057 [Lepraria neglecta]
MIEWCRRIGYEPSDLNALNVIHIAGTKGKGSTSAIISSILAQYLPSTAQTNPLVNKVGLYTSPHLRFVRERIQINNEPLSEAAFAKYFFETWDRLEESARVQGEPTDTSCKPVYFRYLCLMAFHTYIREGVDTAIIECGIGGEFDSTNILVAPRVTGITSLGIDHTIMLGNTIEEIAWHKGGIMKAGAPCFTAPQPPTALEVLCKRAADIPVELHVVERDPALENIKLGLAADFQQTNASLAIAIADYHLYALGHGHPRHGDDLPPEFIRGLEQQVRDANALAKALHTTLAAALQDERPFTHAVFCTNITFKEAGYRPDLMSLNMSGTAIDALEVQKGLAETWRGIDEQTKVEVKGTIEEAVEWCRDIARDDEGKVMVLVTGSTHLVGGFLEVLETGGKKGDSSS